MTLIDQQKALADIIGKAKRSFSNSPEDNLQISSSHNTVQFCIVHKDGTRTYLPKANKQSWLQKLMPKVKLCDFTRVKYQQLLNDYAELHERQTTMDFHHQLKGAIMDAVDEGLIPKDPTRKAIIKGKTPAPKKIKYLNQFELHTLLTHLTLDKGINWDWLILLIAKTGMRFSEALAITPKDFDFGHQTLSISKTWDYKGNTGFLPTKNNSSVRKIKIDWQIVVQFSDLVKELPENEPIFVRNRMYNSTANSVLARHCRAVGVPEITIHGLRHTHASLKSFVRLNNIQSLFFHSKSSALFPYVISSINYTWHQSVSLSFIISESYCNCCLVLVAFTF